MSEKKPGRVLPDLEAQKKIEELESQVQRLKQLKEGNIRVGKKGGVSLYGVGRYPVTLYAGQWKKLFAAVPDIQAFIEEHKDELAVKPPKK